MKKSLNKILVILKKAIVIIVVVFSLVTILRFLAADMFYIPSESMEATIQPGEYVLINKMAYGARWFNNNKITRLPGYSTVKRNDIVVFNFPEGDTVFVDDPLQNYYQKKFSEAYLNNEGVLTKDSEIRFLPIQNRVAYIKRCVGLPGDSINIIKGNVFVNGVHVDDPNTCKYRYRILGEPIKIVDQLRHNGIYHYYKQNDSIYTFLALPSLARKITTPNYNVCRVPTLWDQKNVFTLKNDKKKWKYDSYGPLYIPTEGDTLFLNTENIDLYSRLIEVHESNSLKNKENRFIINGIETNKYIVKQDYYFMMGDNRNGSIDSRTWGFVPMDHIIGKAQMIVYSKGSHNTIRWNRIGTLLE